MFEAMMYPAAIHAAPVPPLAVAQAERVTWDESRLNPKNRVESLDPSQKLKWRIDGGEADGTRFFAIPDFAIGKPPLRIDVWIPDQHNHPPGLREVLESTSAMVVDSDRVADLPISQHLIRALHYWSDKYPNFTDTYMAMPFGSRIVVESMRPNVREMEITLLPNYKVEQQWLSVTALRAMWQLPYSAWPAIVDISELRFVHQMHEAITLVKLLDREEIAKIFVFKSLVNDVKHMYHELKILLTLPTHTHTVPRPSFIVTKKCRFGGKQGVCGFILPYFPHGTLQSVIERLDHDDPQSIRHRLRWGRQATSVFTHIRDSSAGFYSNLKLNNILVTTSSASDTEVHPEDLDILFIDFEQRISWYSWTPPEVLYIEYLDYLVSSPRTPPAVKSYYKDLLETSIPAYRPRSLTTLYRASDAPQTYSAGWSALTASEQASAQVYLLGVLLWCIFEGCPNLNNFVTVETLRAQPQDRAFPEFRHTPPALRDLIERCTSGAREWKGARQPLKRVRNKIYPIGKTGENGDPAADTVKAQELARKWWKKEVDDAEAFVNARREEREGKTIGLQRAESVLGFMSQRPSLEEVSRILDDLEASL